MASTLAAGGESASSAADDAGHFYRCLSCSRCLIVRDARAYLRRNGRYCSCDGFKVSPSWPRGLEWLRPDIALYSLRCKLHDCLEDARAWLGRA